MLTSTIHGKTFVIDTRGLFSAPEERELECWLKGMSEKDAARANYRSPETVRHHRKSMRGKTHQPNGQGVLSYCFAHEYVRVLAILLIMVSALPMARTARTAPPSRRGPTTSVRIGRREIASINAGA